MQKNKLNLHIYGIHLLNPYKTVVSHLKATEISLNSPLWDAEYGTEPFKSLLSSSLVEPEELGLGLFGDTQPSTCRHT